MPLWLLWKKKQELSLWTLAKCCFVPKELNSAGFDQIFFPCCMWRENILFHHCQKADIVCLKGRKSWGILYPSNIHTVRPFSTTGNFCHLPRILKILIAFPPKIRRQALRTRALAKNQPSILPLALD